MNTLLREFLKGALRGTLLDRPPNVKRLLFGHGKMSPVPDYIPSSKPLSNNNSRNCDPRTALTSQWIRFCPRRFKISGQSLEVNLKGTINEVQKDFENPKRLLLIAKFQPTSERNQMILNRLGQNLAS